MTDKKLNTEPNVGLLIELLARTGIAITALSWLHTAPEISIEYILRALVAGATFIWIFKPLVDEKYIVIEKIIEKVES